MSRANIMQTNFTSGEVSPLMIGRVDVNKYANGAKQLTNMIVRPQGGVCRRPGSKYVNAAKVGANYTRIIPFVVSSTVSYLLEFGTNYIRFYTNGGLVVDGSSNPVEVVTTYQSADLDNITYTQSADVMFIACPNYPPQILTRLTNTSWTIARYVTEDGPYLDADISNTRAQVTLVSDITTMTSQFVATANVTATASTSIFSAGSVGKFIINPASNTTQPLLLITAYTSATLVSCQYIDQSLIVSQGTTVMSISGGTVLATSSFFTSSMVNSYIYITPGIGSPGWYKITTVSSSITASITSLVIVSPGAGTITISGQGAFLTGSVGQYVEYVVAGIYYLAQILTVISATQATVRVLDQILTNEGLFDIAITTGTVGATVAATSSYSAVFTQDDVGKYVRDTKNQRWIKITTWTNSSSVSGTFLSMFPYIYPTATMILRNDRVITVTVNFSAPMLDVTDVGTQIRFQFASKFRSLTITSITSSTFATGTFNDYLPFDLINATNAYNNGWADMFSMGAWSTLNGFPAIVCLHQQRLWWGNTYNQPVTLWASQPADYLNMAPTEEDGSVIATNAINVTLASSNVTPITWIHSGQVMLIGTYGSEHEVTPAGSGGISPTNITQTQQSSYGSLAPTIAYRFGVATLFLQRGGNKMREMLYQFQFDAFNSKDITVISEHIFRNRNGAKQMDYQVDPVSIFWIVCNTGDLVSCTYDRDQDVVAFTGHTIAGGVVESIGVLPNTNRDDVYVMVRRTINGSTVRYIEMLTPLFDTGTGDTLTTMKLLDCNLSYSGSAATVISGLSYLNGQVVYAIADGILRGPLTVSGGSITLPVAASVVTVGLTYTSTIGTLSPEGASQTGTSQGKRKTIKEITVRVKDALPFKHGQDLSHLTLIDAANFGADLIPSASQNQLTTGDVRFSLDASWDQQATYFIVQDQPYPLTVESLMPTLIANE